MRTTVAPPFLRVLIAIVVLLVIWGSVFPLHFETVDLSTELHRHFFSDWMAFTGIGDTVGNVILFLPLGLLGMLLPRVRRSATTFAGFFLLATLLATILQMVQIYLPARSPSLTDILWNVAGLLIGMGLTCWPPLQRALDRGVELPRRSTAIMLISLWLAARCMPFVPTLDIGSWWDSVKPLLVYHTFSLPAMLSDTTAWLAIALLAIIVMGQHWRQIYLPLAIAVVTALKIVIIFRQVAVTDIAVLLAAPLLWFSCHQIILRRPGALGWLLLVTTIIEALAPFHFREAQHFEWVPFGGFLSGNMIVNSQAWCEKLFLFGAVSWLLRRGGWGKGAVWFMALAIGSVEVAQIWLPGSTAEITDPLLALVIGLLVMTQPEEDIFEAKHSVGPTDCTKPVNSTATGQNGPATHQMTNLDRLGLSSATKPVPRSLLKVSASIGGRPKGTTPPLQGLSMHPFLVNYTAAQARFIDSLALHMERPQSDVVASIVVTVKEILDAEEDERREHFLKIMIKEPRTPGATYRQEPLVLPSSEMAFVTEIAKAAETSHSCAVRHIVAFFVENVEDGESDDDDEEETGA